MFGLTVLVVEEEYLIAAEIEATLLAEGAAKVLMARNLHDLTTPAPQIDLAIIEAQLGAPASIAFAAALREAGIAVVVTSADRAVTSLFIGSVPLAKPFDDNALLAACQAALQLDRPLTQV
jgi:DNA-binding response OmpR family regulator